jgi:hypothetical protein
MAASAGPSAAHAPAAIHRTPPAHAPAWRAVHDAGPPRHAEPGWPPVTSSPATHGPACVAAASAACRAASAADAAAADADVDGVAGRTLGRP